MTSNKFQYSLTRFCLRLGQMTLPQNMLELFPKEGVVKTVDTLTNKEIELDFRPPRTVVGLGDFYNCHGLSVNDKVELKIEEDNRYLLTPLKIGRKTDYSSPEALGKVLDDLLTKGNPLSESEIREIFPDIPKAIDLNLVLKQDRRFVRYEGRWRPKREEPEDLPEFEPRRKIDKSVVENPFPFSDTPQTVKSKVSTSKSDVGTHSSQNKAQQRLPQKEEKRNNREIKEKPNSSNAAITSNTSINSRNRTKDSQVVSQVSKTGSIEAPKTLELKEEKGSSNDLPKFSFAIEGQGEISASSHKMTRETFEKLGYKIKVLSNYQLILQADLGRYNYNTFVCLLSSGQSLDWVNLLNSRRKLGTKYLAIFGEHNDLVKIYSSTDLARATLWSWQGIERLKDITQKVPISPIDLEYYFKSEGLFDEGIASFEEMIYARIAEQGMFSTILSTLTSLKPPCVFLLDDIALDVNFPREQLAKVLDTLSQAPFQLLSKVDDGEYNMRSTVSDALLNFSEYALSVRDRLHKHRSTRTRTRPPINNLIPS